MCEESVLLTYPFRIVLKRKILIGMNHKFIAICRSIFISYDAQWSYRGSYCMSARDSECKVFLLIFNKTLSCSCFYSFLWFGID